MPTTIASFGALHNDEEFQLCMSSCFHSEWRAISVQNWALQNLPFLRGTTSSHGCSLFVTATGTLLGHSIMAARRTRSAHLYQPWRVT
ncbi:hypothetical protein [Bradyrhizobium liaoningense]|uniref:hypothetical protein n=1 Tax=Bradyrhizobium liaoningense TaxID=43992 RepID=UPI001BA46212|nr:hypothetical protein [Bradyrhizobium liaoningense]MBR0712289.1 hypothetical protein [Bradyrhizobium liaoningense]